MSVALPIHFDSLITILYGDCMEVMQRLQDGSFYCCVTSPPYYNLRNYGAVGQIGREATPEVYIERLVAVFREVKRLLRDDGTLWLNIGDCYSKKDRQLIPARLALALQQDSWL